MNYHEMDVINVKKFEKLFTIIGLCFIFLYGVYVADYSSAFVFKYALVIGMVFFTVELIISFIRYWLDYKKSVK